MAVLLILFWNLGLACFWFSVAAAGANMMKEWWRQKSQEKDRTWQVAYREVTNDRKEEEPVEYEKVNQESGTKILKRKVWKGSPYTDRAKTPELNLSSKTSHQKKREHTSQNKNALE